METNLEDLPDSFDINEVEQEAEQYPEILEQPISKKKDIAWLDTIFARAKLPFILFLIVLIVTVPFGSNLINKATSFIVPSITNMEYSRYIINSALVSLIYSSIIEFGIN